MLSQLEPGIKEVVSRFVKAGTPCQTNKTIKERRNGYLASTELAGQSFKVFEEYEESIDGITFKIFKPNAQSSLPITIYFHGGCFISGSFATHEQQLRQLAKLSNTIVICIQYRLAPENRYPAAHDDVHNGVNIIHQFADKFGGDASKIAFVGDSAGGHLALVTCLRLKAESSWMPNKQILLYPMLDPYGYSRSYQQNGKHFIMTDDMFLSGFEIYIEGTGIKKDHPEISLLLRSDFKGLPTTYVITAEFDALRDEGETLYKKLLGADVDAYCERYLGVIHGFAQLSGISKSAVRCLENIAKQLTD